VEAWHLWAIAALSLSILEVFTAVSGFLLVCFALGCLVSAAVAFLGLGLEVQFLLFSVTSIAAIFGLRPLFQSRFARGRHAVKTNVDALVGKIGVVSERIEQHPQGGRALVEGEDWWAVSQDDAIVEAGQRVKVIQVDGSKLVVERT
jgi:membrane protein implicated in regulation of membrane protease activity